MDEQIGVADGYISVGEPKITEAWSDSGCRVVLWDRRQAAQGGEWTTESTLDGVHV